jgi:hypothetical protein
MPQKFHKKNGTILRGSLTIKTRKIESRWWNRNNNSQKYVCILFYKPSCYEIMNFADEV